MAIKIFKEQDETLTPVDLRPMQELIDFNDPENSEYRYIREYEITDKIQEAIEDTPFMEIAEEALSRSTSAKTMAEKATEDVGEALEEVGEALTKVDELNTKVDGYDTRIDNIDSKSDAALQEAQEAKDIADSAENVADEAKTVADDALAKSISNKNEIIEVEKDLTDTKSSLETTRSNLNEAIINLNTFKQDQHTIDESQNNVIDELERELNTKADKSEIPDISNLATKGELNTKADKSELNNKQDTLESGTNIKTINGESILGSGDIEIKGGEGGIPDAPSDNVTYGRKNGNWVDIPTKEDLENKADKSEIPDVSNLATKDELNTKADKSEIPDISNLATKDELNTKADKSELNNKQDTLESGTNIKTINGESVLGSGNIEIQGGGIEEAPIDGNQYARQNGSWSIVQGGGSGGGDVYSNRDNTFTGYNTFNNGVEFNNLLYTPRTNNIYFKDNYDNLWSWDEFVKYGKDEEKETSTYTGYSVKWPNKKIEWDSEANAYVAKDVEGYTVIQYYIQASAFSGNVENPERYSNLEYFSGDTIDDIHTDGVGGGYSSTFVNFLTSEIEESRYAFEQVNEIPVDNDYNSFQDVPSGFVAYKSTGHRPDSYEYMNITFGETQALKFYNSGEQGCDYIIIGYNAMYGEANIWSDYPYSLSQSEEIKWHKDGSADYYADACWVLLPEDVTINDIEYISSENVPQLMYNYYYLDHIYPKLQKHLELDSNDFNINDNGDYNTISLRNPGAGSGPLNMNNNGVYCAEGYFTDYQPYNNMRFHHGFVPGGGTSKAPGRGIWYNGLGKPYGEAEIVETDYYGRDIFHFYECSGHFIFHNYIWDGPDIILAEITNLGIKEGPDFLKDKYALKSEITPLTPNVVKFGELEIENGVMRNFSATNYAQFPFLMDLSNKAFEITMQITTGNSVGIQQNILDSKDGLAFAIRNSEFVLAVSNNGTSWAFEANGGEVEPNTTYLVKLSWNRLVYSVKYSTDNGENWTEAINQPFAGHPYPRTMLIGKDETGNYYFEGQINLNKCTLSVNNQFVWDGMTDAGLLTRLETDLGNIDQAGIDKINELIDARLRFHGLIS